MTWKNPGWKPKISRIGNFPYIEGCINQDVIFFPIHNKTDTRHFYVYMPTNEAKEFLVGLKEAIEDNERVKGIRTQKHTMRWV